MKTTETLRNEFEGRFDQIKGKLKEAFGILTDDDLRRIDGRWDQFIGTLQEKTGEDREVVERKLEQTLMSLP